MTSDKLRQIDSQRLVSNVVAWQQEIDSLTNRIHELIPLIRGNNDVYAKVQQLQAARDIMIEQRKQMEALLRVNGSSNSSNQL
jgi:hypothetical protein